MAVIDIDDSNVKETLNQNEKVIVKYYASWCGSCRLIKPKYRRLSEDERFSTIAFLDTDAEHNPEARKLAGVQSLPYFAIFKNGEFVEGLSTSKEESVVELLEKL